jgi:hypothetical protein
MQKARFNTRLWGMPLLIAVISLGGLLSALVGDGIWDVLSWAALALPLVLLVRSYLR